MNKIVKLLISIVILVAVVFAARYAVRNFIGGSNFGFHSGMKLAKTQTIVEGIRNISELTTATYIDEFITNDTIKKQNTNRIAAFLNVSKEDKYILIQIVTGRIRAGFDMSKIQEEDITVNGKNLKVLLPPAEIHDIIMNPSDIKPCAEKRIGSWEEAQIHEEKTKILNKAMNKAKEQAIEDGILEKAEKNGIKRLTAMFKGLGFENVEFAVKQ